MTEQVSFTPGPWQWYWQFEKGRADCGVFSEQREGQAYAVARCPKYQTKKQWEADARLIAAAPELLAALKDLCEADRDELNDATSAVWGKAADAIRKAEGKQ